MLMLNYALNIDSKKTEGVFGTMTAACLKTESEQEG